MLTCKSLPHRGELPGGAFPYCEPAFDLAQNFNILQGRMSYNRFVLEDDQEYLISDVQRSDPKKARFIRSLAFPEGESSHTKVAVPDPLEDGTLKVAVPEQPPGIKVASPEREVGKRVAQPSIASKNGDFRRPIQLTGPRGQTDGLVDLKLNKASLHPMMRPRGR